MIGAFILPFGLPGLLWHGARLLTTTLAEAVAFYWEAVAEVSELMLP